MNWLRSFTRSFALVISILIFAFSLHGVRAMPFGLVAQDAEIAPAVAEIGELVSVNMTIKNTGDNTTSCNVTAFCEDYVVGIQEICAIAPKASILLSFKLNTSNLSSGNYSIEVLIKKTSGEQKIFDLGTITIEQEDLTTPEDVTEPQVSPTNPLDPNNSPPDTNPTNSETLSPATIAYSDWQYALFLVVLLPLVPAVAVASILVRRKQMNKIASELSLRKPRNKSQEPAIRAREMEELEKEFEKSFSIGKTKVGLITCVVLVLILAVSSLWLYT